MINALGLDSFSSRLISNELDNTFFKGNFSPPSLVFFTNERDESSQQIS